MLNLENNPVYKKSKVVVSRPLKPETLVIPIRAGSANLNEVYLLNETAGRIWGLLDGTRTAAQVVEIITQEYDVTTEEAQADYDRLVADLEGLSVLTRVAPL